MPPLTYAVRAAAFAALLSTSALTPVFAETTTAPAPAETAAPAPAQPDADMAEVLSALQSLEPKPIETRFSED